MKLNRKKLRRMILNEIRILTEGAKYTEKQIINIVKQNENMPTYFYVGITSTGQQFGTSAKNLENSEPFIERGGGSAYSLEDFVDFLNDKAQDGVKISIGTD